ncbi:MAG: sigma-70 family RNA polymerase sigma factor, partial [Planctomycetota bacterium]
METRASLLLRIKDPADSNAWGEFHDLYAPLIYNYARARGLGHDDAEEVRSACYETLTRQIGSFEYDPGKGGFKAWLRTIVQRRVVDLWRKRREVNATSGDFRDPPVDEQTPDDTWDREWRDQHLV